MMKLILCDINEGLCDEWRIAFENFPEVEIRCGTFEDIDFDCIVSPANSFGLMDGGIDAAITTYFGEDMVNRVQQRIIDRYAGEQPIGTSEIVWGSIGEEIDGVFVGNDIKYVAHTPTMIIPQNISDTDNVYLAMKAMLLAVERHNHLVNLGQKFGSVIKIVVCSGLGSGAGRVPYKKVATDMAKAYQVYKVRPKKISWGFATGRFKYIKGDLI